MERRGAAKRRGAPAKVVVARPGIIAFMGSGLFLVVAGGISVVGFVALVAFFITSDTPRWQALLYAVLLIPFGLAGLYGTIPIPFSRYEISLEGIRIRHFRTWRFLPWREVELVLAAPSSYGAYHFMLQTRDGKKHALRLAFMAHYPRTSRALKEAIYLAPDGPELRYTLGQETDPPPYGVFAVDARRTSAARPL